MDVQSNEQTVPAERERIGLLVGGVVPRAVSSAACAIAVTHGRWIDGLISLNRFLGVLIRRRAREASGGAARERQGRSEKKGEKDR